MDKLQERAIAFKQLLDYEYKIKLGRKGKITEFIIDFDKSDFFHLIGLHKLTDILNNRKSTDKIFLDCLKGNLTYNDCVSSEMFCKIENRFEYFCYLEQMLDSNDIIFKCNTSTLRRFSKIVADFELKNTLENLIFYLFIEKRAYSKNQYCKSFINDNEVDYTYGQTRMTLLYKEKINKRTGESVVQYDRLSEK